MPDYQLTFTYDSSGDVIEEHQTGQAGGNAVADVDVTFTYASPGVLSKIDRYQDGQFVAESDYTYDSNGNLVSLDYSQGSTNLAYYQLAYASGTTGAFSTLTTAADIQWTPSPGVDTTGIVSALVAEAKAGNSLLTSVSSIDGTATYSYDATGQLMGAAYSSPSPQSPTPNPCEIYSYDSNGNRNMPGYVTGPDNELLSDGTCNYTYDADGNCISRTTIATGAVTEYTWDNRNRLVEVEDLSSANGPVTEVVNYYYDTENRWIGETVNQENGQPAQTTHFAYDGEQIVLQFEGNEGPTLPAGASEANGVQLSFGNLQSQTNAVVDCLFAFAGRPADGATGLENDTNRWRDAGAGRWLSEDPLGFDGRSANLYRDVANSSTNATDPAGLVSPFGNGNPTRRIGEGIVIGEAGSTLEIPAGGVVFVTDIAPERDVQYWTVKLPLIPPIACWSETKQRSFADWLGDVSHSPVISDNVPGWDGLEYDLKWYLKGQPNGTLSTIVLGGHGSGGAGVQSSSGNLDYASLPTPLAHLIEEKLRPGGVFILASCQTAGLDPVGMQKLADKINRPVIGNTGLVSGDMKGAGLWVKFLPRGSDD